jgi:biopolymer transport protein ExbB/TolQ
VRADGAHVIQVLAAVTGGTTVILVGLTAWLTYKLVSAQRETMAARDLLNGERQVSAEYRAARDIEVTAHAVTKGSLAKEKTLRVIAESQRNEAQRKARDLLRKHMRTATDDEIRETVADLFTTPLGLVPRDGVRLPNVGTEDNPGPDALLRPKFEL